MPCSAKCSAIVTPARPVTRAAMGRSVVWKPVATMIASTGRSAPARSTMPVGVTRAIASVTSSTSSRASVGYHVFEISTRLQPIWKSGVTLRRSSGSAMPLRMLARAIFRAGSASLGCRVKAGT